MTQSTSHDHISRITTIWSDVFKAHGNESAALEAAQSAVMERYSGAVYRYLVKILSNRDAADEVFQEWALSFVRGGFRHADPQRGRFRDYLKIAVLRLVTDHRRKQGRDRLRGGADIDVVGDDEPDPADDFDGQFSQSVRDELMSRSWEGLRIVEEQSGQPVHAVLEFRASNSQCTSEEMADELTARLRPDAPFTSAGIRKTLQRARAKFSDLLLYEISQTLNDPSPDELERELIDLGLGPYCHSAWKKRYAEHA